MLTHHDAEYGFSFDYPTDWMLDAVRLGERAPAAYQLTSWVHEPGMVSGVPEGGSIMSINVQLWDPRGDLDAYAAQRRLAWEASSLTLLREEEIILVNGNRALTGVIEEPEQGQGYFLFTTLGDYYLSATGDGDVAMLELIARSIR
jgi:hypothetical protein